MITVLLIATCIGAGTVGGVFFAFSTFVIQALAQLPPANGVAAMQRINVVVLNPLFLGVFMGTALLAAGCVIAAFLLPDLVRSTLAVAAGVLYLGGTFLVTVVCNVPRNDRLGRFEAASADATTYWPLYVHEWSIWNHVRTAASLAAAACAAGALAA